LNTVEDFDPFLMLDGFDSTNPKDYIKGFPWHPHRGIETVTYLLQGEIEHGDSLGNRGIIRELPGSSRGSERGICKSSVSGCSVRTQLCLALP
jgi:hypothetical protein